MYLLPEAMVKITTLIQQKKLNKYQPVSMASPFTKVLKMLNHTIAVNS